MSLRQFLSDAIDETIVSQATKALMTGSTPIKVFQSVNMWSGKKAPLEWNRDAWGDLPDHADIGMTAGKFDEGAVDKDYWKERQRKRAEREERQYQTLRRRLHPPAPPMEIQTDPIDMPPIHPPLGNKSMIKDEDDDMILRAMGGES